MRFSMEMQKQPLEHNICIIHILPRSSLSEPITLYLALFPPYSPNCDYLLLLPFCPPVWRAFISWEFRETILIFFGDEQFIGKERLGFVVVNSVSRLSLPYLSPLVSWISLTSLRICFMAQPGFSRCDVSSCKPLLAANTR